MKQYLIFCSIAASAVCHAATVNPNTDEQQKKVMATPKPVSTRSIVPSQQSAPPRHLSDAERAELRRQLRQFDRQYGKRS
ncbi:MAG TPA: hypothetical protein VIE63_00550 [Ramlibacter sp.]